MATERNVLITNLEYVPVHEVRTFCHALLLCEAEHALLRDTPRRQLRGFGVDPAWPVFDLDVPSIEYTLTSAASPHVFIGVDGPRPLMSGAIMHLNGGPTVQLVTSDRDEPLDVEEFNGGADDRVILRVWDALPRNVARYWTAPNMPRLAWGRAK